jgi:cytochrome c556
MLFKAKAAMAALLVLGAITAASGEDDPIKARQAIMKANGAAVGPLVKMSKGDIPFDAVVVRAGLETFHNAAKIADLFPAGSDHGDDTRALPTVWSDRPGLLAALAKLIAAAEAQLANPPKDADSLKAALTTIAPACGGCHTTYRRPNA